MYCYLPLSGSMKFFCREQCKEEDVLIKTGGARANRDRYSIEYKDGSSGRGILHMTFTHLSKSDSGQYRCGLGKSLLPDSFWDFEIRVSDGKFLLKVIYHVWGLLKHYKELSENLSLKILYLASTNSVERVN